MHGVSDVPLQRLLILHIARFRAILPLSVSVCRTLTIASSEHANVSNFRGDCKVG